MQTDRDRWQASVLSPKSHVHQMETTYELSEVRDSDRLRQSISGTSHLAQSSEVERLMETVTQLQSQLAETRRAEVEAREACNLLRLKSAMAPADSGYAQHQYSNGDVVRALCCVFVMSVCDVC